MQIRLRGQARIVAALLVAVAAHAIAQGAYPSKPIKIIAPVQPGGGVDLVARQIGDRLAKALGQPVVVDNQSGGGGVVGSLATARAAPDGYTLMVGYVGTHGTLDIVHVPYRGIGPAFADILGGQTQAMMPGLAAALPHIKAGKVRPLAVTGSKRHPLVPDVPTFEESGFAGFDGVQWYGIVGPANLPPPIIARLNSEINRMLESADLRERLSGEALEPMPMTPEQFGRYIRDDVARWSRLAKERNIQISE